MNSLPFQAFFKNNAQTGMKQLNKAMGNHMLSQPSLPTKIQKPQNKPIPRQIKMKMLQQSSRTSNQQKNSSFGADNYSQISFSQQNIQKSKNSKNFNQIKQNPKPSQNISTNSHHMSSATSYPTFTCLNIPYNHYLGPNQNNFYNPQASLIRGPRIPFDPSFGLLRSSFPLFTAQDQIYLPLIDRLQKKQTKCFFSQLYVNLKYLVLQSDDQFWKYLYHLFNLSQNGLSQKEVLQGYKLRLAIQGCLTNFSIKQFNKCVDVEEVRCSIAASQKKIYQYQLVFESQSFKTYERLVDTVLEFYQKLAKVRHKQQARIVVDSWYFDTLKSLDLAMIYGNKQPVRVKNLIKKLFSLDSRLYAKDFKNVCNGIYSFLDKSNQQSEQLQTTLLQHLSTFISAKEKKSKKQSFFLQRENYFARDIFEKCSDCLKLFMVVTNIFKFFPSHMKLIFMENLDLLKALIRVSTKVIYNLRQPDSNKKRKWKLSEKVKLQLKDMEFMLIDKICEMYKFIFFNIKKAVQQQVLDDNGDQKTQDEKKQQIIIFKFYKKLIQGLINKKKDKQDQKEGQDTINKETKKQFNKSDEPNQNQIMPEAQINKNQQQKISKQDQTEDFEETLKDQYEKYKKANKNKKKKKKEKQTEKNSKSLNQGIQQKQYGRILLKYLLRKQLKKNKQKYMKQQYFYTKIVYNYFVKSSQNQFDQQQQSSQKHQQHLQNLPHQNPDHQSINNNKSQEKSQTKFQTSSQTNSQKKSKINSQIKSFTNNNSFHNLSTHLIILKQFQSQIKEQYRNEKQLNSKFFQINLKVKQLPTIKQFIKQQQLAQKNQLMNRLNIYSKQYDDQPQFAQLTQQQQRDIELNQKIMDRSDFTQCIFNIGKGDSDSNNNEISFNVRFNNNSNNIRNNNNNGYRNQNSNYQSNRYYNRNRNSNHYKNNNPKVNNPKVNNPNNNNIKQQKQQQLSPQKIIDYQYSQQSLYQQSPQQSLQQQSLQQSYSRIYHKVNRNNSRNNNSIKDRNRNNSNNSNINNNNNNNNNKSLSNLFQNNSNIFKPSSKMNLLTKSMIRQQQEYYNRIKNVSWGQISAILIKQQQDNKNEKDKSLTSFLENASYLKVSDIGYSFDMVLNNQSERSFSDYQDAINNKARYTHFYYDKFADNGQGKKKKSFMQQYEWSYINNDDDNSIQEEHNQNGKNKNMLFNDNQSQQYQKQQKYQQYQKYQKYQKYSQQNKNKQITFKKKQASNKIQQQKQAQSQKQLHKYKQMQNNKSIQYYNKNNNNFNNNNNYSNDNNNNFFFNQNKYHYYQKNDNNQFNQNHYNNQFNQNNYQMNYSLDNNQRLLYQPQREYNHDLPNSNQHQLNISNISSISHRSSISNTSNISMISKKSNQNSKSNFTKKKPNNN